jgi:hypothetical protein
MNLHRIFRVLMDVPGDPAGGGGGSTPLPDPGAAGTLPAPGSGQAPAGGTPAPQPDEFDRRFQERIRAEGYLPRHAATRLSSSAERLQAQLEQERQRVRALTGVEPQPDPEETAIRGALTRMFPWMSKIQEKGEIFDRMFSAFEDGTFDSLVETRDSVWGRNAHDAGGRAAAAWAEATGVQLSDLPAATQQRLGRDLRNFILDDETGARNRRYAKGDSTLIDEFVADQKAVYITPFQQKQQQQVVQRQETVRRLPQQGPKGGPPPQQGERRLDRRAVSEAARQSVRERMADA